MIDALRDAIADRDEVEWFSPAHQSDGHIAGPAEVHVLDSDGTPIPGWRVEPIPVEPGGRRYRRFRAPDGWVMLTEAATPTTLFLVPTVDLHTVASVDGIVVTSAAVDAGSAPSSGDAYTLEKANVAGTAYRLSPAWSLDAVSAALSLWCASFLDREVAFVAMPPAEESPEFASPDPVDEPAGATEVDPEIAEIISGYDDVFWFQADLSWPDKDDAEAFRDRIDVRMRDEGYDTWLASVEPIDDRPGIARTLEDGGRVLLDPEDAGSIRLEYDRLVLAVNVQDTGFEPAGVSVPLGTAPTVEQWEELRRVRGEHQGSVVISTPGWSEHRVGAALTVWADTWAGARPRFVYDFDDPVSQAAIEANNRLEHTPTQTRSVRTAVRQICGHTEAGTARFEIPLPCNQPATAYYMDGDAVVLVCDTHAPDDVRLTTLLRA